MIKLCARAYASLTILFLLLSSSAMAQATTDPTGTVNIRKTYMTMLVGSVGDAIFNMEIFQWRNMRIVFVVVIAIGIFQLVNEHLTKNSFLLELTKMMVWTAIAISVSNGPTTSILPNLCPPGSSSKECNSHSPIDRQLYTFLAYTFDGIGDSLSSNGEDYLQVNMQQLSATTTKMLGLITSCGVIGFADCAAKEWANPQPAKSKFEYSLNPATLLWNAMLWLADPANWLYPLLLYIVKFLAIFVNYFTVLIFAMTAAMSMFFCKLFSVLLILPRYRSKVLEAFKMPLSTTLYGLMTALIVALSGIFVHALNDATRNTITKLVTANGSLNFTDMQTLMTGNFLCIIGLLCLQLVAYSKIPALSRNLWNLQLTALADMAETLLSAAGGFAKAGLGIAVSAGAVGVSSAIGVAAGSIRAAGAAAAAPAGGRLDAAKASLSGQSAGPVGINEFARTGRGSDPSGGAAGMGGAAEPAPSANASSAQAAAQPQSAGHMGVVAQGLGSGNAGGGSLADMDGSTQRTSGARDIDFDAQTRQADRAQNEAAEADRQQAIIDEKKKAQDEHNNKPLTRLGTFMQKAATTIETAAPRAIMGVAGIAKAAIAGGSALSSGDLGGALSAGGAALAGVKEIGSAAQSVHNSVYRQPGIEKREAEILQQRTSLDSLKASMHQAQMTQKNKANDEERAEYSKLMNQAADPAAKTSEDEFARINQLRETRDFKTGDKMADLQTENDAAILDSSPQFKAWQTKTDNEAIKSMEELNSSMADGRISQEAAASFKKLVDENKINKKNAYVREQFDYFNHGADNMSRQQINNEKSHQSDRESLRRSELSRQARDQQSQLLKPTDKENQANEQKNTALAGDKLAESKQASLDLKAKLLATQREALYGESDQVRKAQIQTAIDGTLSEIEHLEHEIRNSKKE
jgi:hypothetical protein